MIKRNLRNLYKVTKVPSDTCLRERLDKDVRRAALEALSALAPFLTSTQVDTFLESLQHRILCEINLNHVQLKKTLRFVS